MDNDNPAEMSNSDLEKDMQKESAGGNANTVNQEDINKSTAAEGTLKDPSSIVGHHTSHGTTEERDLDDLVHRRADEEDSQDGSLPNPEDVPAWEGDEIDDDKISS